LICPESFAEVVVKKNIICCLIVKNDEDEIVSTGVE
jgi:hypothetical protein